MSERLELIEKWKEAVARQQFDIAGEYFQRIMEVGAKDLDEKQPGAGQVWRELAHSVAELTEVANTIESRIIRSNV